MTDCYKEHKTLYQEVPHNIFWVWQGPDFWHQEKSVQVRLEKNGEIFISCACDDKFEIATVTLDELHGAIAEFVKKKNTSEK